MKLNSEIRSVIDEQSNLARKLLEDNRDQVEAMTKALLEWETIDAEQIDDIMAGKPPRPPKPVASSRPNSPPGDGGSKLADTPSHASPAESA